MPGDEDGGNHQRSEVVALPDSSMPMRDLEGECGSARHSVKLPSGNG